MTGDLRAVIVKRSQSRLDVGDRRAGRAVLVGRAGIAAAAVVLDIGVNLSVRHHLGIAAGNPIARLGLEPAADRIHIVEAVAGIRRADAVGIGGRL